MKLHTRQLTCAAIVGAAYAVLSIFGSIFGITYGPIQFTSDHASNYLPLKGTLPQDAPGMIAAIDSALSGDTAIRAEWQRGL